MKRRRLTTENWIRSIQEGEEAQRKLQIFDSLLESGALGLIGNEIYSGYRVYTDTPTHRPTFPPSEQALGSRRRTL